MRPLTRIVLCALLVIGAAATPTVVARAQEPMSTATAEEVVQAVVDLLRSDYIYEDRAAEIIDGLRVAAAAGKYAGAESPQEFAELVTHDMYEVSSDAHLRIWYEPSTPEPEAAPAEAPVRLPDPSYGFRSVSILEGNVGYLDLRGFAGSPDAQPVADAALGYLSQASSLIIDLRRNSGGGPWMVRYLSGFLFDEPTHLVSTWFRGLEEPMERWTLENSVAAQPDMPVFVLTSGRTFSAAESFTFGLRINDRITVVGERTGGGGHFGSVAPLPHGFMMFVPEGRTYDPQTGEGWEAEGIGPDVATPAPDALRRAHELALGATLSGRGTVPLVAAWSGSLDAEGTEYRLTVQLERDPSGQLVGRLVDHNQQRVRPLTVSQPSGSEVRLEFAPAGITIVARLEQQDTVLVGTYTQAEDTLPLRLERR